MRDRLTSQSFQGIGASGGIALGKVVLFDKGKVKIPRYSIVQAEVAQEIERFQASLLQSIAQLHAIRQRLGGDSMEHQAILDAHEMMLQDEALSQEVQHLIAYEKINAEWAVGQVVHNIVQLFEEVSDSYFRERQDDIHFLADRLLRNLIGQHADWPVNPSIHKESILVTRHLSPVDATLLSQQRPGALVTEMGTKTSHAAIIARSLEIPTIVGVKGIFDAARQNDTMIVNGLNGQLILNPTNTQKEESRRQAQLFVAENLRFLQNAHLPAQTADGRVFFLNGNIELPQEASHVLERGGDGIGLFRTESLFLQGHNALPSADEHYETYKQLTKHIPNRPIVIRTLDLGGDKNLPSLNMPHEANPALGLRAIRYSLQHQELFHPQIAGLLRAALHGDIKILLPMIASIEELLAAKQQIEAVKDDLRRQGIPFAEKVPIGIMIEVPSAALTMDLLAPACDFISIGTNDLMQYLLAIDRTNGSVAYLYRPMHPVMLRTLHHLYTVAKKHQLPTMICGEVAGDIDYLPILIGCGFQHLSLNGAGIAKVKQHIRLLHHQACQALFLHLLTLTTTLAIENAIADFLKDKKITT